MTATPSTGYRFSHWSGSASGSTNPLSVTMSSDKTIVANFSKLYELTTSVAGGSGTITRSPNKTYFMPGEMVTLTAVPAAGYLFHRWGGDADGMFTSPLTVIMNSDVNDTAYFGRGYTLTVSSAGGGTVFRSPSKTLYPQGEVVTVTAIPNAGYRFSHWSGSASGSTNPLSVTVSSDKTIVANFVRL